MSGEDVLVRVAEVAVIHTQVAAATIVNVQVQGGVAGPRGSAGSSAGITHIQTVSSTVWNITHSLGYYPNVSSFDSIGDQIEGDIDHIDNNSLTITFSASVSGVAYLS